MVLVKVFILYAIFITISFAQLTCTTNGDEKVCQRNSMPLYNQRLVSDMHCAPTAASMGLATFLNNNYSPSYLSWTNFNFKNKSETERITNFGVAMLTLENYGTGPFVIPAYKDRASDFWGFTGNADLADLTKLTNSRLIKRINQGFVDILSYGHYSKLCRDILGSNICTYSRDGGHFIAVNGYTKTSEKTSITFHDPWNGVIAQYDIQSVSADEESYRPHGDFTNALYTDGDAVKIIDFIVGIRSLL